MAAPMARPILTRQNLVAYSATFNTSLRLYVPQDLHTLCVLTSSPHLPHAARFAIGIFHVCARRLSRLDFDIFPFGQIIRITSGDGL